MTKWTRSEGTVGREDLPIFKTGIKESCRVTFVDTCVDIVGSSIEEKSTLQSAREGDVAIVRPDVREVISTGLRHT